MQLESDSKSKMDLLTTVAHKCADLLKDPTLGGKKDLSAEDRTIAREEAYEHLIYCLDCFTEFVSFHEDYYEIFNIAKKLKIDLNSENNEAT
jgi:hypothetical protein